jgi:hypothetical protein
VFIPALCNKDLVSVALNGELQGILIRLYPNWEIAFEPILRSTIVSCGRTTVNRHGAAPRVSRTYAKSGDGKRGFNRIERIFRAETARLQALVFP